MTPNRPYLLRALFDWICDNNCTPYLLVDATLEGVEVPFEHVNAGRIVLNASGSAVANFDIDDERVSFNTRFSGRDTWINVPMAAVLAIYAKETQEGMTFAPSDYPDRKQRADYFEGGPEGGLEGEVEVGVVGDSPDGELADEAKATPEVAPASPAATPRAKSLSGSKPADRSNHLKVIK